MSPFYLFAVLLLLLLAVVIVSAVRERSSEPDPEEADGRPEDRLAAALAALRELEFDRETDKLAEEEYRRLHRRYAREALAAREALEAAEAGAAGPGAEEGRCGACRARVPSGARFCPRCGTAAERASPEGARVGDGGEG